MSTATQDAKRVNGHKPTSLEVARDYRSRGWAVLPIKHRQKGITREGWQSLRITEAELPSEFRIRCNIGVLTGEPSGGLVDVDLDDMLAVELADQFLPPTQSEFGRASKPRSHRLYRLTSPAPTHKRQTPKDENGKRQMIAELRSTGCQTVFPGSVHPSGEPIEWHSNGEPPEVDADFLKGKVDALADEVLKRKGIIENKPKQQGSGGKSKSPIATDKFVRASKYVAKMPPAIEHNGGSDQTYAVACALVLGFDMTPEQALPIMQDYNARCQPPWSERELQHKLDDADKETEERGKLLNKPAPSAGKRSRKLKETESVDADAAEASGRPIIVVNFDIERQVDQAIAALARRAGIYQRGGSLTRVLLNVAPPPGIERPDDAPRLSDIGVDTLNELLPSAAVWCKLSADGEKLTPTAVPDKVTKAVAARGYWLGISPIVSVCETPVLRSDGSVLENSGYDPATGIYFHRNGDFPPVPERPTFADVVAARDKLLDVVADFPFASDAHKAAWVASVLTPFARYAFAGCAPLVMVDGNTRGVGKGLLIEATTTIISGRGIARMAMPRDDVEFGKKITALAIAGETLVLIDNVAGTLGCPSFDAALTATSWSDRVLGASKMTGQLPLYITWYCTGNNISLGADTARRTLHVRLETTEENPEHRTGFKHPNLIEHVQSHRGELAIAAVTILKAYVEAGRPNQNLREWGSYEAWSALVRSAVVWAGMADPGDTRIELAERSDTEAASLRQIIAGWIEADPDREGMTVAEAARRVDEHPERYPALRDAFHTVFGHTKSKPTSLRSIGKQLSKFRRRVTGGVMLDSDSDRNGVQIWSVRGEIAGFAGFCGVSTDPNAGAHTRTHAHAPAHARGDSHKPSNTPQTPQSEQAAAGACDHEPTESLTFDRFIRTTCIRCGEILKPDRKAEVVSA